MQQPHLIEHCKAWTVPGTDWVLQGFSQSANKTGFAIFSLKLMFDAGMPTEKNVRAILLSHSHSDHSFHVPTLAMGHRESCTVYCPQEMVQPLHTLCRASQSLNDCVPLVGDEQVQAIGVSPGEVFSYCTKKSSKQALQIRVVACCHTVPSVGFEISQTKTQLKPEYRGKQGFELAALKKEGHVIHETVRQKKMTFLGDTNIDVFQDESILADLPVLVVECTIVDDVLSPQDTRERGHVHWYDLKPVVERHPSTTFVLIHFSKRYDAAYLTSYFAGAPKNVKVWV